MAYGFESLHPHTIRPALDGRAFACQGEGTYAFSTGTWMIVSHLAGSSWFQMPSM